MREVNLCVFMFISGHLATFGSLACVQLHKCDTFGSFVCACLLACVHVDTHQTPQEQGMKG